MHPSAFPHDDLQQLYPDVYLLHGSIRIKPGVRISRNMLVLRHEGELTLINPVRMNDAGLVELEALGKVTRLIRLGHFHGLDDVFYKERYQCEFWAQPGQRLYKTPSADKEIDSTTPGPIPGSEFFLFPSVRLPEAALYIEAHRLLVTTDSVQYYDGWRHFSLPARMAFPFLGFHQGMNIGPMWLKAVTPKGASLREDFDQLLAMDFDALISAHGQLIKTGAKAALQKEVDRVFGS